MSTHFPNRIPNCILQDWFIIDSYFTQIDYLKYNKLKEIWEAGYRNLYISMGSKYNYEMCKYIDSLSEYVLDDFKTINFSAVLFDSLNMPQENINKLIYSEMYIKPNIKHNYSNRHSTGMFKAVKYDFTNDEKYFINIYRNFISSNDYNIVKYYYSNQLHIKTIINAIKGPFISDYGVKLFKYLGEMMSKTDAKDAKDTTKKPVALNYDEMKEIINYCADNKYINWSQSIN